MFDLRVWKDTEADGRQPSRTPGKGKDVKTNQMQRLAKLSKKHRNGQIPRVDWLDRLTFREIEMINNREKNESDHLYLLIEFQTVLIGDHTVKNFATFLFSYGFNFLFFLQVHDHILRTGW